MHNTSIDKGSADGAEIVDFDEVLMNAMSPEARLELYTEATMLAEAFAPEHGPEALQVLSHALAAGERDAEIGHAHARRLAAALRQMAKRAA